MSYELTEKETVTMTEPENTLSGNVLKDKCYSLEESKSLLIKKIKSTSTTKCFLVLFFSAIISHSFAQITTLGEPAKEEPKIIIPQYDSLTAIIPCHPYPNEKNRYSYKHLIGQKVYVVHNQGCSKQLRSLLWSRNDDSKNWNWPLDGHYMTIIDPQPFMDSVDSVSKVSKYPSVHFWPRNAFDIAFKDDTTKRVFFYEKSSFSINMNRQLVVVGHLEKIKQLYYGKEFVFVKDDENETYSYQNGIYDLNTRNRVLSIKKGTHFLCTGISIDDQNGNDHISWEQYEHIKDRVVLLLHNDALGDFYCYATSHDMNDNYDKKIQARCRDYILGKFLSPEDYAKKQKNDAIAAKKKKEADQAKAEEEQAKAKERQEKEQQRIQALVDKYGESNVNLARQGKVKIGWNKELCKEAWGEPRSVNKTTTAYGVHEQWVYSTSRYLYFDDGILTAIQE